MVLSLSPKNISANIFFRSGVKNLLALLLFFQKLKVEIPGYGGGVFHCSHPLRFFPTKRPTTARVGNFFERSRLISLQFWNTITTSHYLGSYDHSFWENLTSEITFFKDTELSDKKKKLFFRASWEIWRKFKKIILQRWSNDYFDKVNSKHFFSCQITYM